ncbi:MAG: hypothetical protein N2505_05160 [Endomicrobia bacterium]|nr:hypothetical protein [Endomicrobiia bacterium]
MNYSFQVAYLNAIRQKKLIPEYILEDISVKKNFSSLFSLFKEYNFKVANFSDNDLLDAYNFELVIKNELEDTLVLINSLLYSQHSWLVDWIKSYFIEKKFSNIEELILFFENSYTNFKKFNSKLIEDLINLIVDFENIKLFLSYSLKAEVSAPNLKFLRFGRIDDILLKKLFPSLESLSSYLSYTYYPKLKLTIQPMKENINYYFNYYLKELIWQSKFYYFTIEPIIFYFFEKLIESQKLKEIYYEIKFS